MVIGPDIDPPALQNVYRPSGVYRAPDTRAGCEDRTLFEVWAGGKCIAWSSIDNEHADAGTEAAFWNWYDQQTDPRLAVNAPAQPRPTPRHLRAL